MTVRIADCWRPTWQSGAARGNSRDRNLRRRSAPLRTGRRCLAVRHHVSAREAPPVRAGMFHPAERIPGRRTTRIRQTTLWRPESAEYRTRSAAMVVLSQMHIGNYLRRQAEQIFLRTRKIAHEFDSMNCLLLAANGNDRCSRLVELRMDKNMQWPKMSGATARGQLQCPRKTQMTRPKRHSMNLL